MPTASIGLRQDERFLRKAFHKSLLPCMLSILSNNVTILADGILVGQRLGTDGLSAVSLCLPVYLALCVVGSFLTAGTAIQASRAIGRQQTEKTQQLYHTAVFSSLAAGLVVTLLGLALLQPLAALLCQDQAIRPLVATYAGVTLIGSLPKILLYVPFWYLRMDGRAKMVAWMMAILGVGNILLDLLFLYPLDMGIAGAAWASVLATAAACVLGFLCLCGKGSSFRLGRRVITSRAGWREIASAGSPSALNNLFDTLRQLTVNTLLLAAGGSQLVAAYTAVNCIYAFSLCVVDGVPQTASAMLGIYSGELDNDSSALLLRREWRTGLLCCALFALVILLSADGIAFLYGLPLSLRPAMACLAIGMFPALVCTILSGYYNVSGHVRWSVAILFCRVFLGAALGLSLALALGWLPWTFLFLGELMTLLLWFAATGLYHKLRPGRTRFLLMDRRLEEEGQVLNFSVPGKEEDICQASSQIADFCQENGMTPRQVMRFSLAIEEVLTMIAQKNPDGQVRFDLRAFAVPGSLGIRIRYDGIAYDPFAPRGKKDEAYLGIDLIASMMSTVFYQRTFGLNTVQLLL